jgi:glycosyltransferase involved in cell wall biosynthesis
MRIAWVLYGSLEQRTGGTIYDAHVVDGLKRAGDDVHVLSLDDDDAPQQLPHGLGKTLPPIAKIATIARAGFALAKRIEAIDPDVVVGDELCFRELGIAFRRLGHETGARRVRRVLLVHHLTAWEVELSALRRRVVRAAERFAIEASDAVIVTSCTTKERLVREGVRERIDVVLPGADRLGGSESGSESESESGSESESQSGSGSGVRFVFLGAVVGRKRVLELVRAFGGGAHTRGRLRIVGSTARDVGYVRRVRDEIARLGLGGCVVMAGEVDEGGVRRALADADVLVMPSTLEGYGIAATEAIYAGVPVIAARAQGLEEALAPCPDATLFADDEDALAKALDRFAHDDGLRASMIEAARTAASRMPTWASCAEAFRAALLTLGARE